jgi:hypothetical protein
MYLSTTPLKKLNDFLLDNDYFSFGYFSLGKVEGGRIIV